jgi:hypothetical protein
MILGRYKNPHFKSHRSPRQSPSLSPEPIKTVSPDHSPKRKRTDEIAATPSSSLRIETAWSPEVDPEIVTQGANSPRTKVAARLRDLEIHQATARIPAPASLPSSSQSPRKRLKRNPGISDQSAAFNGRSVLTPQQRVRPVEIPDSVSVLEIGETPQPPGLQEVTKASDPQQTPPSSPPLSPSGLQALRKSFGMTNNPLSSSRQRLPSPPPPTPHAPTSGRIAAETSAFAPCLPNVNEAMFDLSALTWQDNEITGHELDATSPDDDGEGINGIGFQPTPAMAYARSQKRRQQVEGWKLREAREARQRRMDRRRGGSSDPVAGEAARRVVRFSDAG